MRFDFTSEQVAFRDAVRELLARECPPARIRAAWADGTPLAVWPHLARAGVVGMTAPERWGGLGLDVLVLEEAGRAGLPEPLLETTAVAIPLVSETAPAAFADRWLGAAAAGRAVLSVGLAGAPFVADAARADLLVLEHDGDVHAIERAHAALTAQPSVDGARKLARVDWRPGAHTLLATGEPARAALARAFDRGALAAAGRFGGFGRRMLGFTVESGRSAPSSAGRSAASRRSSTTSPTRWSG